MTRWVQLPGLSDYAEVHAMQRQLVEDRAAGRIPDTAETITVGRRRGAVDNVLAPAGVPVVRVERGGDVTWHGPGQLVAYPILLLEGERQDLHRHLHALEDAVIGLLTELGLEPGRDPRNTGVWLPEPDGAVRKVCSVGIACRKWVTWHGLALNVRPDPLGFARINPCGFEASVMTRVVDHLPDAPTVAELALRLIPHLRSALYSGVRTPSLP